MQAEQGYDPKRSRVSDDTMMDFIRGSVGGDITEVPGIGPAAAKKLADGEGDESITNTYQLIGKVRCFHNISVARSCFLFAQLIHALLFRFFCTIINSFSC